MYRRIKKGHLKNCCNYPKMLKVWFYHVWEVMHPKGADRMANNVDPIQTVLIWSTLFDHIIDVGTYWLILVLI